jgi:uncharacterized protein (DUF58 family)
VGGRGERAVPVPARVRLPKRGVSSGADMAEELFNNEFMKKLEYLATVARRLYRQKVRPRRRKRIGTGLEFADRRGYEHGDDIRYVDWNFFARMERLLVRLFEEEQEMMVYFLLDSSESMMVGSPPKFDYARRALAALAYLGLANFDRVSVWPFSNGVHSYLAPKKGKAQVFAVTEFLNGLRAGGATDFDASCASFVSKAGRPGLAVVLSDFFAPMGYEQGLKTLFHNKFDLFLLSVYDHRDAAPDYLSDVRLLESETGRYRNLTVNSGLRAAYAREFAVYQKEIEAFAVRHNAGWLAAPTSLPFEEIVLKVLRLGEFVG